MKLFFLDLETTGVNPGRNGIHQMSGMVVIDGVEKETFNFNVRPNHKALIEKQALDVAGVTEEQVLSYPPMEVVYREKLIPMLDRYIDRFNKKDKFFIVGYNNAHFDNDFFRGFFLQNGDKFFGSYFWANCFDCMVLATPYLADVRPSMENFKQGTVAKYLGIEIDESKLHDALYDIRVCKQIYDKVCGKY